MAIFLEAYQNQTIRPDDVLDFQHPLMRRMSFLQKAGLAAFHQLEKTYPENFEEFLLSESCEIFFTTTYGEIHAVSAIANQINSGELPVSPLAFQHSVNNASSGYLAIVRKMHKNIVTFGSGFLALDKAIYWIYRRMNGMEPKRAILVHGDEFLFANEVKAKVEVLIFSNEPQGVFTRLAELCHASYAIESNVVDFESAKLFAHFSKTGILCTEPERVMRGVGGEVIRSQWRPL